MKASMFICRKNLEVFFSDRPNIEESIAKKCLAEFDEIGGSSDNGDSLQARKISQEKVSAIMGEHLDMFMMAMDTPRQMGVLAQAMAKKRG